MSTRAPLVMASRAALNWSLPCGNSTVYWGGLSPASLNASFRYFASNFLKCGAVASLGRMTAMLPVPLAASGLRADMALNLLLTWISENCGPDDLAPPGELEDGLPVQLQQAARTRARAAQPAHAVRAAPLTERNGPPHISHHHPGQSRARCKRFEWCFRVQPGGGVTRGGQKAPVSFAPAKLAPRVLVA